MPLSKFWGCQQSSVCRSITLMSASIFTGGSSFWIWLFLCVFSSSHKDTCHIALRTHPTSITLIMSEQLCFQIRSYSELPGKIQNLGDTIQPSTPPTTFLSEWSFFTALHPGKNRILGPGPTVLKGEAEVLAQCSWSLAQGVEGEDTGVRGGDQWWERMLEWQMWLEWGKLCKPRNKVLTLLQGSHWRVLMEKWWRWWGL